MIDFLNENAGFLTVIFTGVVTISTVVYAFLTAKLVSETRKMRQVQTEPKIVVTTKPREEWINLIHMFVKNIGQGPAFDITFKITSESGGDGANTIIKDFIKSEFINTGLKYLGPNHELASGWTQMTEKFDDKIETVLVIDVSYKSSTGELYSDTYRLDFSEYKGRTQANTPYLYNISQNIEKIQKDFHHITTGFRRLNVDIFNNDDRKQEKEDNDKIRNEFNVKSKESKNN